MSESSALETARACAAHMLANDRASRALGIAVTIPAPGRAVATMAVREDMLNGFDIAHGGLICALADSAFAFACNAYDEVAVAGGITLDLLRPAAAGDVLTATAVERRRGRRAGVYDVTVENQRGETVALLRGRAVPSGRPLLPDGRKT